MVDPPGLLQQLPLKHAKLDLKHRRSHQHQANVCYSLQLCHVGNGAVMNIRYPKLFCQKQSYIYTDAAKVTQVCTRVSGLLKALHTCMRTQLLNTGCNSAHGVQHLSDNRGARGKLHYPVLLNSVLVYSESAPCITLCLPFL